MRTSLRVALAGLVVAAASIYPAAWAADTAKDNGGKLPEREMILPSSRLGNLDVFNRDNPDKKLGNLDNLIINAHTGDVLYGIVDTGLGGKNIPVPWRAMLLNKTTKGDDVTYWMSLNKTTDDLAKAPTFDASQWPDFTKSEWKKSVDNFFGVHTVAKPGGAGELTTNQLIFRSSKLGDLNVYHRGNTDKKLGNLDNLIINSHTGKVLYGILDTGLAGKHIAVPWKAFEVSKAADDNNYWLTLTKTQDELANAPTYDKDKTDVTDMKWQRTVTDFFGMRSE